MERAKISISDEITVLVSPTGTLKLIAGPDRDGWRFTHGPWTPEWFSIRHHVPAAPGWYIVRDAFAHPSYMKAFWDGSHWTPCETSTKHIVHLMDPDIRNTHEFCGLSKDRARWHGTFALPAAETLLHQVQARHPEYDNTWVACEVGDEVNTYSARTDILSHYAPKGYRFVSLNKPGFVRVLIMLPAPVAKPTH